MTPDPELARLDCTSHSLDTSCYTDRGGKWCLHLSPKRDDIIKKASANPLVERVVQFSERCTEIVLKEPLVESSFILPSNTYVDASSGKIMSEVRVRGADLRGLELMHVSIWEKLQVEYL